MRQGLKAIGWVCVALLALGSVACGPSEAELAAQARVEEWAFLEEAEQNVSQLRTELSDMDSALAEDAEAFAEAKGMSVEEATAAVETKRTELDEVVTELDSRLTMYINDDPWEVGAELSESQLAAVEMMSRERLVTAHEFVEKGGDYKRAVDIVTKQLEYNPGNEHLEAALAAFEEARYIEKEQLDEVKKNMTEAEVRAILGPVYLPLVKEYPNGTVAWFYPTAADKKSPAGVFFEKKRGRLVVYDKRFDVGAG